MKTEATKKKLTLKAKKPDPDQTAEGVGGASAVAETTYAGQAVVDASYHKPALIAAILALLVFLGLVVIQATEWFYYQAQPSVWPPKLM